MTAVTVDVPVRIITPDIFQPPVRARLGYDPARPLEIRVRFYEPGDSFDWVWSRDLLTAGLRGAAGVGDVRVWRFGRQLRMRLLGEDPDTGREVEAVVALPRRPVARFLARTFRLVPPGREPQRDWDADLAELLGGAR